MLRCACAGNIFEAFTAQQCHPCSCLQLVSMLAAAYLAFNARTHVTRKHIVDGRNMCIACYSTAVLLTAGAGSQHTAAACITFVPAHVPARYDL
jgi:hypothetical protein